MYTGARLEITGKCDLQCLYCHAGEKNTQICLASEMTLGRWSEVIAEAKSLGVRIFTLTGGEPFLNPDWMKIAELCGAESRVIISTNGEHFSEKNLEILSGLPQVVEFRTSLDGLAANDIIRDGSSFQRTLASIKRLKEYLPGAGIMIQTTTYQNNLGEIEQLYEILKGIPITRWRLAQLWKTVRTEKNRDILDFSNYRLMFRMYARIIRRHQADGQPFRLGIDNVYDSFITREEYADFNMLAHPCLYEFEFLCVNANGDLVFCPALNLPYASVKNMGIAEAVAGSSWLRDFKAITIDSLPCGNCRYLKICGGGCRADAYRWLGDLKTLDPNSCCIMRRVEEQIMPVLNGAEQAVYHRLINSVGDWPPVDGENIEEAVARFSRKGG
ncbi:MAG: radical SAM protein [Patescibacteria group bacterium]|nr:radical SAM protein [Patescibacteria group bacterium]